MIEPKSVVTCEDCMDLMARYPDKYFDLAIVDPPYGEACDLKNDTGSRWSENNGFSRLWVENKQNKWNVSPPTTYFDSLWRVSKNQIIWGGNHFALAPMPCWIVWDKGQREFSFADAELAWTSFESAVRVFDYPRSAQKSEEKIHPTQKPVKLYDWLLGNYAEGCKTILDTHLGSGSSRIAAHKAGFDFVGCEIDKDYFAAQEKRFQDYLKQLKFDFLYSQKEGK